MASFIDDWADLMENHPRSELMQDLMSVVCNEAAPMLLREQSLKILLLEKSGIVEKWRQAHIEKHGSEDAEQASLGSTAA